MAQREWVEKDFYKDLGVSSDASEQDIKRAARKLLETFGLWKFPDERPLAPPEVLEAIAARGQVLQQKTLWPLILTQHLIVARKAPEPA